MDHLIGGYDDVYEMTKAAKRRVQRKEVTAPEPVVVTASAVVLAALGPARDSQGRSVPRL
jgi:hypothetical protein